MPLCDEIDPAAEAIGSVNTIVRCADGKLVGYNTDIDGFLYMACRAGISLSGKKVVILGSGGASLTAQTAARQGGAAEVVVVSRFGPDNYDNLSRHADAEILVNATPVGMYPGNGQSPVDLSVFPVCQGVLDVIYNPRRTAISRTIAEEIHRAVEPDKENLSAAELKEKGIGIEDYRY